MRRVANLSRICAVLSLTVLPALAAERVTVHRAELTGPAGTANGLVVSLEDRLVFVDEQRPEMSFAISRSDVKSVTLQSNGLVSANLTRPVTNRFGERSDLELRLADPASATALVKWVGSPMAGDAVTTGSTLSQDAANAAQTGGTGALTNDTRGRAMMFEVQHDHAVGNDPGRLIVGKDKIQFVSLEDAAHKKTWTYDDLAEVRRNETERKIILRHRNGEEDTFIATNKEMDQRMYQLLADNLVEHRANVKVTR